MNMWKRIGVGLAVVTACIGVAAAATSAAAPTSTFVRVGGSPTVTMADPPPSNSGEPGSVNTGGTVAMLFR